MYLNIRLWQCFSWIAQIQFQNTTISYHNIFIHFRLATWRRLCYFLILFNTFLKLLKFQPEMTKWKINYIIPKTFQISSFHLIKRRQKMLNEDGWNLYLLIQIGANIHTHVLLIHQSVVCSTWWWLCVLDSSCIIYMIYIKKRLL